MWDKYVDFSVLEGETLVSVDVGELEEGYSEGNSYVTFKTLSGRTFQMYHSQDCCESVCLEDVVGDWNSLLNVPVLLAECRSEGESDENGDETWTFYTIRTVNGTVDMRWYGESNGYYSTSVGFWEVTNG